MRQSIAVDRDTSLSSSDQESIEKPRSRLETPDPIYTISTKPPIQNEEYSEVVRPRVPPPARSAPPPTRPKPWNSRPRGAPPPPSHQPSQYLAYINNSRLPAIYGDEANIPPDINQQGVLHLDYQPEGALYQGYQPRDAPESDYYYEQRQADLQPAAQGGYHGRGVPRPDRPAAPAHQPRSHIQTQKKYQDRSMRQDPPPPPAMETGLPFNYITTSQRLAASHPSPATKRNNISFV